jgi:hypothetical protein
MTRNQWIVLGALAVAVALTFGYLLTHLGSLRASLTSTPLQPIHMATEAPAETSSSATSESAADYGYRLCFQDVAETASQLGEDLAVVTSTAEDDPQASCEMVAELDLPRRAAELKTAHEDCPAPSDAHLQAAQRHLDSSLVESVEAVSCIDRFCAGSRENDWWSQASAHVERAREEGALAGQEMEAFYGAY